MVRPKTCSCVDSRCRRESPSSARAAGTVRFGALLLPGVTLHDVWNGKEGRYWQDEALAVEVRSPVLEPLVERDRAIVEPYDG